jgi:hypothetical protein
MSLTLIRAMFPARRYFVRLVVAAGAGRRAAELRIAGAAQRCRTIRISVRIAVIRMQDDGWSGIHGASDERLMMRRICECIRA